MSNTYTAIGEGHVSAKHVSSGCRAELGGTDQAEEELAEAVHAGDHAGGAHAAPTYRVRPRRPGVKRPAGCYRAGSGRWDYGVVNKG